MRKTEFNYKQPRLWKACEVGFHGHTVTRRAKCLLYIQRTLFTKKLSKKESRNTPFKIGNKQLSVSFKKHNTIYKQNSVIACAVDAGTTAALQRKKNKK